MDTGEYVVVQSTKGPELARVVVSPDQVLVNEIDDSSLKPILRLATPDDLVNADDLKQRAKELLIEAKSLAAEAGFPGHLDDARFTLDGARLSVSFSHDSRVEYRNAARGLSDSLGVRVDMNQIGARDRARLAGGYGKCGRELCCANWLDTFPAISIRMAKEQELPLNPQKISGLCGRLLCCLSYEDEGYRAMRKTLPKIGARCSTPTGEGKVIALNILQRKVTLIVSGQRVEVGDRDLGLIVRWDPSSKAAPPPPSLTPAEGVRQGILTQEEADEREREDLELAPPPLFHDVPARRTEPRTPQRDRPRKEPGETTEPRQSDQPKGKGRSRSRSGRGARPGPTLEGAKTRSFRRNDPGNEAKSGNSQGSGQTDVTDPPSSPPEAQTNQQDGASTKPKSSAGRRRRGRRRGRPGSSNSGNADAQQGDTQAPPPSDQQ